MADIDLNTLDLSELKRFEKDIAKAIASFEGRKRTEALAALDTLSKEFGFTLEELTGLSTSKKRTIAEAKYVHPENPSVTWSGRGRRPQWIKDSFSAGRSLEEFAI